MKQITILISISVLLLISISCNNKKTEKSSTEPKSETVTAEADAKEMIKVIKNFIDVAANISADQKLTDDEIKQIELAAKSLSSLKADLDKKYVEGSEGKKAMDKYKKDHNVEMQSIYKKLMSVEESLSTCEGYEKLDL